MPDLENLLREELQHEAQKVQPELLRPLQVPTRRPSWRPRLLPFAAAAAVIAVITAGALVAGLTAAHKPAAHKPAVSGSAPASLPRFYVTTSSSPGGRGIQAVVRASASGQVTGTVPVPSALPVEWADSGGTFVTAAADDRSFIIGVQGGQAPTKNGLDLRLFRFAISAAGKPGHLTELAPAPMRNETTEGIALSPDGKLLAVSLMNDSSADSVARHSGPQPGHRGHPDLDRAGPQRVYSRAALLGGRQPGNRVHLAALHPIWPHVRAAGNPAARHRRARRQPGGGDSDRPERHGRRRFHRERADHARRARCHRGHLA